MINNYVTFNSANTQSVIEDVRIPAIPNMAMAEKGAFKAYFEVLVNANGCPAFYARTDAQEAQHAVGYEYKGEREALEAEGYAEFVSEYEVSAWHSM